jgi:hypothetical protein
MIVLRFREQDSGEKSGKINTHGKIDDGTGSFQELYFMKSFGLII